MDKETIPFDCKRKKTRGGSGAKSIVCCQKKIKKKNLVRLEEEKLGA